MFDINTLRINTLGYREGLFYFDTSYDYDNMLKSEKDLSLMETADLEYVELLLKQNFSYIKAHVGLFPDPKIENVYFNEFAVYRLRMENMDIPGERFAWRCLLQNIRKDFTDRRSKILRNKDASAFQHIISDGIEEFEPKDRLRLEQTKLEALVLFVYDYCMLSLRETILHPEVESYITDYLSIGGARWRSTRSINKSIEIYLQNPYEVLSLTTPDGESLSQVIVKQNLDLQLSPVPCQNPKATDSNVAAMFIDLLHRFFVAFGIKRRGQWGRAEKILLYNLLQFFGLCHSQRKASDSTYISTLFNEHGNYFEDCHLQSWIRNNGQPYAYLLGCGIHPTFDTIENHDGNNLNPKPTGVAPITIQESCKDIAGTAVRVTNASHRFIVFSSEEQDSGELSTEREVLSPNFSYVTKLIEDHFLFVGFFPSEPKYFVVRKDLHAPGNWNKVLDEVKSRFNNADNILRENVDKKDSILQAIRSFREMHGKEDRKMIDTEKLYFLFLFIYDYVIFTYKEAALRMEIKRYLKSTVEMNGKLLPSTALIDDMLREYLLRPYTFQQEDGKIYRGLRDNKLLVPDITPIIAHPSANVVNMTAMFYDLFSRFFSSFGLSKRKGAKLSELEKDLIANLAFLSGIGNSNKGTTVASIYSRNRDYFIKSQLSVSIRENEYWHLMLNTQEEELFGPAYHKKQ